MGIASHFSHTGQSVTGINPDGSLLQVLSGGNCNFGNPQGIGFDGAIVWILDEGAGSVVEVNPANGNRIGSFSGLGLSQATSIAFDGAHLWIANQPAVRPIAEGPGHGPKEAGKAGRPGHR